MKRLCVALLTALSAASVYGGTAQLNSLKGSSTVVVSESDPTFTAWRDAGTGYATPASVALVAEAATNLVVSATNALAGAKQWVQLTGNSVALSNSGSSPISVTGTGTLTVTSLSGFNTTKVLVKTSGFTDVVWPDSTVMHLMLFQGSTNYFEVWADDEDPENPVYFVTHTFSR